MIQKLNALKQYNVIAKNTFYLSIIEGLRLLMPFIALPYIIHTVGGVNYGKICFAQTVIAYFLTIVDFGLNIVAVKEVAVNIENKEKLSSIVSAFLWIRLFLCSAGLIILLLLLMIVPLFKENSLVILFSYILVFAVIIKDSANTRI